MYGAPYSPHLNPIENYFFLYKHHLKRNSEQMHSNWWNVHMEGLNVVDSNTGIKYFRRCGIPGSRTMITTHEYVELLKIYNVL